MSYIPVFPLVTYFLKYLCLKNDLARFSYRISLTEMCTVKFPEQAKNEEIYMDFFKDLCEEKVHFPEQFGISSAFLKKMSLMLYGRQSRGPLRGASPEMQSWKGRS